MFRSILTALSIAALVSLSARAGIPGLENYTVTTFSDELDGTNGLFSLREAVQAANTNGLDTTIQLSSGLYALSITGAFENAAASGDLDITSPGLVTIEGNGCDLTIIDGGAIDRVFDIFPGANVTLRGVTIRNGKTPDGATADPTEDAEHGGGIRNQGTLAVLNSCIVSNAAGHGSDRPNPDFVGNNCGDGGDGGGIWNSGSLTASNSLIEANQSGRGGDPAETAIFIIAHPHGGFPGAGGGMYNAGSLLMIECTVRSNTTGRGGNGGTGMSGGNPSQPRNGGNGSAILNAGQATLLRSTIEGNSNGNGGRGGDGAGGSSALLNNGENGGSGGRGGESAVYNAGSLYCTNVTVSGNNSGNGGRGGNGGNGFPLSVSDGGNGGSGGVGGDAAGIYVFGTPGNTVLSHVTLANNQAGTGGNGGNGGSSGLSGGSNGSPGSAGGNGAIGGMLLAVGSVELYHTLIADNLDGDGNPDDISGAFNSLGYNLVETTSGYALLGTLTGNQTGVDPQLEPLADNGGSTLTHRIPDSSPAFNAGDPAITGEPDTDQRGLARVSGGIIDIGAFEFSVLQPEAPVLHWPLNEGAGSNTLEAISGETNVAIFSGAVVWDGAVAPTDSTASVNVDIDLPSSYIKAGTLTSSNTYVAGTNSDFRILAGQWTMTAWINLESPQGAGGDRVIASSRHAGVGSAWWLWFVNNSGGKPTLQYDFNSSRSTADFEIPLATNVFVVIQGDNSATAFNAGMKHRFALWDGTCWSFTEGTLFANAQLHDIELGSFNEGTRQFDGRLDDVRIYDTALSLDQLDYLARSDADGDGTLDYLDADDDNDGLTDGMEQSLGTNTKKLDSDGDSMGDNAEVIAGTNPLNETNFFYVAAITQAINEVSVTWPSVSNRVYAVWCSSNLLSDIWTEVSNNIAATPPANSIVLPAGNAPAVYSVEVE